jgi:hypothetical protein
VEQMEQPEAAKRWFREVEGLNDEGYIPGPAMPPEVMLKEKVAAVWRRKNATNGYKFRKLWRTNRCDHRRLFLR